MTINGREVNFLYTVGAWCDINDYVVENPDVSAATANVHKAVIMNREYNLANGLTDHLTIEEIRSLPAVVMFEVLDEIKQAEERGSKRTVEAEEKNAKSTAGKK